jgi:hypothetical protein
MFKLAGGEIRQDRGFVGRPVGVDLDDTALIRAQLARLTGSQLRRFIGWLDQRGAVAGKAFAVHQADPKDPATRDLVELQVLPFAEGRPKPRLPLAGREGYRRPFGRVARR